MAHRTILPFLIGFSFLMACRNTNVSEQTETQSAAISGVNAEQLAEGFQLLETNCFSCHSPNASMENRAAPPMEAVKRHYFEEGMTEAEFSKDFVAFLQNPNKENSKMPGAIRRFGVMPKMNFTKTQLQRIATYVYHSKLEQPDWFEKHYEEEHNTHMAQVEELTPLEKGQKIAMQTKAILGKNLLTAINAKGTDYAVDFCSTRAITLTDSMALALGAKVKRVSDQNRNPLNAANDRELAYITEAKATLADGKKLMPKLIDEDGKTIGYYPIMTNGMCLQCHGKQATDIKSSTLAKIHEAYPNDKAIGYASEELRGIWVVEMEPEKLPLAQ